MVPRNSNFFTGWLFFLVVSFEETFFFFFLFLLSMPVSQSGTLTPCPPYSPQSTLLNMIAGLDSPDMGELVVGETVDVMYVDQNREGLDDPELSVFEAVTDGAEEINLGPRTINRREMPLPADPSPLRSGGFLETLWQLQLEICELSWGRDRLTGQPSVRGTGACYGGGSPFGL